MSLVVSLLQVGPLASPLAILGALVVLAVIVVGTLYVLGLLGWGVFA